jgi:hypothetical protein
VPVSEEKGHLKREKVSEDAQRFRIEPSWRLQAFPRHFALLLYPRNYGKGL